MIHRIYRIWYSESEVPEHGQEKTIALVANHVGAAVETFYDRVKDDKLFIHAVRRDMGMELKMLENEQVKHVRGTQ